MIVGVSRYSSSHNNPNLPNGKPSTNDGRPQHNRSSHNHYISHDNPNTNSSPNGISNTYHDRPQPSQTDARDLNTVTTKRRITRIPSDLTPSLLPERHRKTTRITSASTLSELTSHAWVKPTQARLSSLPSTRKPSATPIPDKEPSNPAHVTIVVGSIALVDSGRTLTTGSLPLQAKCLLNLFETRIGK